MSLNTVRRNKREFSLYSLLSWIFRASAGTRAKMDRSYRCRLMSDSGDGDSSCPSSELLLLLLLLLRTASGLVGVDGGDESPLYVDRAVATRGGLRCTRGTNGVQSGNSAAATTTDGVVRIFDDFGFERPANRRARSDDDDDERADLIGRRAPRGVAVLVDNRGHSRPQRW